MTPDINVLVAASRADHPHHATAREWLDAAIAACETGGYIAVLPMVAAGFLRLVTNIRVFPDPSPIEKALGFMDALLAIPGVEMADSGREWQMLRRICLEGKLTGNAIPDAWIAATVKSVNGHLVTFDRGFTRLLAKSELTVLSG
jgi:toxin-antitoxin system PIN domain toxin